MNLGKLLLIATKMEAFAGDITGVCVMCCKETEQGLLLRDYVSGNFTGWSYFFTGNCMCPECAFLFSDQVFRKKSWIASSTGFRIFKNNEASSLLFNPPNPPFFIHIAKTGQKQTWLACLNRVAYNPYRYFFSHERYDVPILFEREKASMYISKICKALDLSISKTELFTGEFRPKTWRKAYKYRYQDFLWELTKYKGNFLWEVMVDVARK